MADVIKDDSGQVQRVIYKDTSHYAAEVGRSPFPGKLRITTKSPSANGAPVDLELGEAKRFARDVLDLAGGEEG